LFSISNDRLYRWTLSNRWLGQVVADYRAGLGIPPRIEIVAVSMVVIVLVLSVGLALDGLYGILFIVARPREVTVET
jgi:uncharacterized membrane protein YbaN (DUF454 family)